jgi:aspartokinase/homoserine dehydrogenase 1
VGQTTAAIVAGALDATDLEIWTDVNGMYTANPRIVKQAQPIASISYRSNGIVSFWCQLFPPPPACSKKNIPIHIKNTFEPKKQKELIFQNQPISNGHKRISHIENITLITLGPTVIEYLKWRKNNKDTDNFLFVNFGRVVGNLLNT